MRYSIAKQGVFQTIQGEGALLGMPMVFIRLAGCSLGCKGCDTNYQHIAFMSCEEIQEQVNAVRGKCEWIWVTGGEPTDQDLRPLLEALRLCGRVAVATNGARGLVGDGRLVDFLSVSPHSTPNELSCRYGSQINLVPGLNDLRLSDWENFDHSGFKYSWVTPINPRDIRECRDFVEANPKWKLGIQAHKVWGIE